MRKLEVTTTAGCKVNCSFCPQASFYKNYLKTGPSSRQMSFSVFKSSIDKLPSDIGISFGGMSEPFQNKECADMILYAKEKGHVIGIFTTLVGLDGEHLHRILTKLSLGRGDMDDKMYVHVPSDNNWEHIPVTPEHLAKLQMLIDKDVDIEFHYHGDGIHQGLLHMDFRHRLNHWPLHDRSFNEISMVKKSEFKKGKIACVMNMEVNVLIPNGDVLLCCQDFGIDNVIGNLVEDDFEDLYTGASFKNALANLKNDTVDSICRSCHFAIEEDELLVQKELAAN